MWRRQIAIWRRKLSMMLHVQILWSLILRGSNLPRMMDMVHLMLSVRGHLSRIATAFPGRLVLKFCFDSYLFLGRSKLKCVRLMFIGIVRSSPILIHFQSRSKTAISSQRRSVNWRWRLVPRKLRSTATLKIARSSQGKSAISVRLKVCSLFVISRSVWPALIPLRSNALKSTSNIVIRLKRLPLWKYVIQNLTPDIYKPKINKSCVEWFTFR